MGINLKQMIFSKKNSSHVDSRYSDINSSKKPKYNPYLKDFSLCYFDKCFQDPEIPF